MRLLLTLLLAATLPSTLPAQWELQESHTTASLRGIHSIGNGVAWASGTSGTVLRTTDGGTHWQTCPVPPGAEKLDFRGIQAFDDKTAVVMSSGKGDLSRLYKTVDGCQSWKLVFTNPDKEGFWDAIQFGATKDQGVRLGVLIGDAVEGHFPFFLSFDEGEYWERQIRQSPEALEHEAIFAASNSSLLVVPGPQGFREFVTGGSGGPRFMGLFIGRDDTCPAEAANTVPGARPFQYVCGIWRTTKLTGSSTGESMGAFSMASRGAYREVVVGGDYLKPDVTQHTAWFADDLFGWHAAKSPPQGYRSAVAYSPEHKAWITVGPNGTDVSTDDGRNWRPLRPGKDDAEGADRDWNALSLPFVVGPKGRIGKLRVAAINPAR